MSGAALERVFREASARIVGVLAARFRNLALAEDAFSEACARALQVWPMKDVPADPAAWLYQVAVRAALESLPSLRLKVLRSHWVNLGRWTQRRLRISPLFMPFGPICCVGPATPTRARAAYEAAIARITSPAEREWLRQQKNRINH